MAVTLCIMGLNPGSRTPFGISPYTHLLKVKKLTWIGIRFRVCSVREVTLPVKCLRQLFPVDRRWDRDVYWKGSEYKCGSHCWRVSPASRSHAKILGTVISDAGDFRNDNTVPGPTMS